MAERDVLLAVTTVPALKVDDDTEAHKILPHE